MNDNKSNPPTSEGREEFVARGIELLRKTISVVAHVLWHKTVPQGAHLWSIPVDKDRDWDCILSDAITELELRRSENTELRASLTEAQAENERLKAEKKQLRDAAETLLADVSESDDHTSWFNSIAALNKVLRKQESDGAQ